MSLFYVRLLAISQSSLILSNLLPKTWPIVMAYIRMAYIVMALIVAAYIVVAHIVMACLVMAHIVMAYVGIEPLTAHGILV